MIFLNSLSNLSKTSRGQHVFVIGWWVGWGGAVAGKSLGVAWGGNVFSKIVQEQSTAHLKPRDLSSKYVQIAGSINSLSSSKQLSSPLAAVWSLFRCQSCPGSSNSLRPTLRLPTATVVPRAWDDGGPPSSGLSVPHLRFPPCPCLSCSSAEAEEPRPEIPSSSRKPRGHLVLTEVD